EQSWSQSLIQGVLERVVQVAEGAASLWLREQSPVERAGELARKVAAATLERLHRSADSPCRGGWCTAAHGVDAAQGLVQDKRQGVQVGCGADLVALALLGSHVDKRAQHVSSTRQCVVPGQPCAAEVGELCRRWGRAA